MDLTTVSTEDLEYELRKRELCRLTEIRTSVYHERMTMQELVKKMEINNIYYKSKAITMNGALLWLEYKEYDNATGGVVFGLNCQIGEEVYYKNHLEALATDLEIGTWIKLLS